MEKKIEILYLIIELYFFLYLARHYFNKKEDSGGLKKHIRKEVVCRDELRRVQNRGIKDVGFRFVIS